ncbi:hypothetical protein AAMO2058_000101800 [Amorphochlora amoebiformis]
MRARRASNAVAASGRARKSGRSRVQKEAKNNDIVRGLQARLFLARRDGKRTQYQIQKALDVIQGVQKNIYSERSGRIVNMPARGLGKRIRFTIEQIVRGEISVIPKDYDVTVNGDPANAHHDPAQPRVTTATGGSGIGGGAGIDIKGGSGGNIENDPYLRTITFRSGSYAILMAFHDTNSEMMRKSKIIQAAQKYCDEAMDTDYHAGRLFSGWSSIRTLERHRLIIRRDRRDARRSVGWRGGPSDEFYVTERGKRFTAAMIHRFNPSTPRGLAGHIAPAAGHRIHTLIPSSPVSRPVSKYVPTSSTTFREFDMLTSSSSGSRSLHGAQVRQNRTALLDKVVRDARAAAATGKKKSKKKRKREISDSIQETAGPSNWNCPVCTFENNPYLTQCEVCSAAQPKVTDKQRWVCSMCTLENDRKADRCQACMNPRGNRGGKKATHKPVENAKDKTVNATPKKRRKTNRDVIVLDEPEEDRRREVMRANSDLKLALKLSMEGEESRQESLVLEIEEKDSPRESSFQVDIDTRERVRNALPRQFLNQITRQLNQVSATHESLTHTSPPLPLRAKIQTLPLADFAFREISIEGNIETEKILGLVERKKLGDLVSRSVARSKYKIPSHVEQIQRMSNLRLRNSFFLIEGDLATAYGYEAYDQRPDERRMNPFLVENIDDGLALVARFAAVPLASGWSGVRCILSPSPERTSRLLAHLSLVLSEKKRVPGQRLRSMLSTLYEDYSRKGIADKSRREIQQRLRANGLADAERTILQRYQSIEQLEAVWRECKGCRKTLFEPLLGKSLSLKLHEFLLSSSPDPLPPNVQINSEGGSTERIVHVQGDPSIIETLADEKNVHYHLQSSPVDDFPCANMWTESGSGRSYRSAIVDLSPDKFVKIVADAARGTFSKGKGLVEVGRVAAEVVDSLVADHRGEGERLAVVTQLGYAIRRWRRKVDRVLREKNEIDNVVYKNLSECCEVCICVLMVEKNWHVLTFERKEDTADFLREVVRICHREALVMKYKSI